MKGRLEDELKNREHINKMLQTMPEYVADFYYNIRINASPTTCIEYLRKIRHFLNYFNNIDIKDINVNMIAKYFDEISYTKDKDGEIKKTSGTYKKCVWTALNRIYDFLYEEGCIDKNPMKRIPRPKQKDEHKYSILTADDMKNMAKNPPKIKYEKWTGGDDYNEKWKERDAAILSIFCCTGIRKTALTQLNMEDISFDEMTIHAIDKRDKVQIHYIAPEMMGPILNWISKREEILNGKKCDALFITDRKERMSSKTMYRVVQRYTKEMIGVPLSPHKLRGAFGECVYDQNGHDIEATKVAMGHASISTTSIYIKNKSNSRKEATEGIAKFIYG